MSTQLDYTVGIGKESVYGTAVAPTRFFETEAAMDLTIDTVQGTGLRPGKRMNRLNRNSIARKSVAGDMTMEIPDKGFGMLLEAVLGTPTLDTAGDDTRMTFLPRVTDPVPSYTIEEVIPFLGGTTEANGMRFTGCVANSLTIEISEGSYATATISWLGRNMTTATAKTVASYPANDALLAFVESRVLFDQEWGDPAVVRNLSLTFANNLDTNGYNMGTTGSAGLRSRRNELGRLSVTGSMTVEYASAAWRTRYLNRTPADVTLQLASSRGPVGDRYGLEITSDPSARGFLVTAGGVPKSAGGDVVTQDLTFEVFDGGGEGAPISVSYFTDDTAV